MLHAARWLTGLLLIALAFALVLIAFRQRDLAVMLETLGLPGVDREPPPVPHAVAFWITLVIAAAYAGVGSAVAVIGDRIWFGLAVLLASFGAASGAWAQWSPSIDASAQLGTTSAVALIVIGSATLLVGLVGWAVSPAGALRNPTMFDVPTNHEG